MWWLISIAGVLVVVGLGWFVVVMHGIDQRNAVYLARTERREVPMKENREQWNAFMQDYYRREKALREF